MTYQLVPYLHFPLIGTYTDKMLHACLKFLLIPLFITFSFGFFSLKTLAQPSPDFDLAESFFQAQNYERASILFERLYLADKRQLYFERLKVSLYEMREFEKLSKYLKEEHERKKSSPENLLYLALCYNNLNQPKLAEPLFKEVVESVKIQSQFEALTRWLFRQRAFDALLTFIQMGRERFGNPTLLADELGNVYVSLGKYNEATTEFLSMLRGDFPDYSTVSSQILSYATKDNPDVLTETIKTIEIKRGQYNVAMAKQITSQLLSTLYMEKGDYLGALKEAVARDNALSSRGAQILMFAQLAFDKAQYSAARNAFQKLADPSISTYAVFYVQQARFGLAKTLEALAKNSTEPDTTRSKYYESAIQAYRSYETFYPTAMESAEVILAQARLFFEYKKDYRAASETLERLNNRFRETQAAKQGALIFAKLKQREGNFSRALSEAKRVASDGFAGREIRADANLLSGEIGFLLTQFDSAIAALSKIESGRNASNNALLLKLFLQRALSDTAKNPSAIPALKSFAEIKKLLAMEKQSEALLLYKQWKKNHFEASPQAAISDEVLFDYASLLIKLIPDSAVVEYEQIAESFPKSYFADKALFILGEYFEAKSSQLVSLSLPDSGLKRAFRERSIKYFERILRDYPKSIYQRKVREKIRKLRNETA
ncbi:MAG: hypothetical protein SFU91_08850 [Chloroherpetonaceae bacterium]|nr:hypothetical protein [Chloroherpetonaceae bacterium]